MIAFNPYNSYRPFCGTLANSADPDQTPQNTASDQGFHCLLRVGYNYRICTP